MKRAIARLTMAAALAAATVRCNGDPPLDVAPAVDLARFQGKWYEIASLPRTTQADCYGTTAFYSPAAGGSFQFVHQCNVGSTTGPLRTATMTATLPDPSVPAKLALEVSGFSGDYWILEVGSNYEYAVVGHPSRAYLWILSRTPTLDTGITQGIVERAQRNQFDTASLHYTPQPPGGERVSADAPVGPIPPAVGTGCSAASSPGGDAGSGSPAWVGYVVLFGAALAFQRERAGESRNAVGHPQGES
jgi:apolipoprotein D and lipocalin family protein